MPPRKFVSKETLESIRKLVHEGKKDLQIANLLKMLHADVYGIRKNILKISLYGSKRKCDKCREDKSVTCFHSKSQTPDWCIICRKKFGGEKGGGRPAGIRKIATGYSQRKGNSFVVCTCLRCDKTFKSEIFVGFGGRLDHYRCCSKCQNIINGMEQVSI